MLSHLSLFRLAGHVGFSLAHVHTHTCLSLTHTPAAQGPLLGAHRVGCLTAACR